jgi:hypothetical protein
MPEDKKQDDVKSFEAALAGLMPRADRLDRDRLMFLAGQQSILPSTFGRGTQRVPGGEGGKRKWAWPSAFATMSAVATVLLAMVVYKPAPQVVDRAVKQIASESTSNFAAQSYENTDELNPILLSKAENGKFNSADSPNSYSVILNQIITKGVDSWKPNISKSYNAKQTISPPLTNRELMDQLLNQSGA